MVASLLVDGTAASLAPTTSLAPGSDRIEIGYTATGLTLPERIRFRYRLEPIDRDWQEVGLRRTAFYNNLAPGAYRFSVQSTDTSGAWSSVVAEQTFRLAPLWFQTLWFKALVALALVAAMALAYRIRIDTLTARLRQQARIRLAERERISRDLHDTLLQGLYGLILRIHALNARIVDEPVRRDLSAALDHADGLLADGRDRVATLRSANGTQVPIAGRLREVGESLKTQHAAGFDLVVHGDAMPLGAVVRDEVESICSEALSNAFRHADASRVVLTLGFESKEFSAIVRDDGRGIDVLTAKHGRDGHWGIVGMRERAGGIGAVLEIGSSEDGGTRVTLRIAGRLAYEKSADPRGNRGRAIADAAHVDR